MNQKDSDTIHKQWARLRFSIVGSLLYSPPPAGELKQALRKLSQQYYLSPATGVPVRFGLSTIERWYYRCRKAHDPIKTLHPKRRQDAGQYRALSVAVRMLIKAQYESHKSWSYQLHVDNLLVELETSQSDPGPSYSTLRRYMKRNGMIKQRRLNNTRDSPGRQAAANRLANREVRSYEVDHVNGLWHLDYHHGSRQVLTQDGQWMTPMLLAIMDDRSRVICHAQWYLDETAESLVHGYCQAIQKRAIPRAVMSDNGAAMVSAEFTQGLERLSIVHKLTLPYSPYQNAKQEFFWTQIEGRLMAMLEGKEVLTLALLNTATLAWIEQEYHHKRHTEIGCTPMQRYLNDATDVGRQSPSSEDLRRAFRIQQKRRQRRSDGTVALAGQRFEIPSRFRHMESIHLQYARWDLSFVEMVDDHDDSLVCRLWPLDKSANASGLRRTLGDATTDAGPSVPPSGDIAPLLRKLMADYAADGLPPAYLVKDDQQNNNGDAKDET